MQLVAVGAQDTYLTNNPQITFFKVVYRRHTPFSVESIKQTFTGTANFGNTVEAVISRNGDLITNMYLQTSLPAVTAAVSGWVNRVGWRLLNYVELKIGGQTIDKQYSTWMHVWTELTHNDTKKRALDVLVGAGPTVPSSGRATGEEAGESAGAVVSLNIPLQFWFCRNPGLALPLIALQYHEVKVAINFETIANCESEFAPVGTGSLGSTNLWVDYVYLDTEERVNFAQNSHEYLIEQTQIKTSSSVSAGDNSVRLNFNHPVKELLWVTRPTAVDDMGGCKFTNFAATTAGTGANNVVTAKLKLNNQDRFEVRNGVYFDVIQPYQHHSGTSQTGINCYSFALKPEEHQPSGTCNMSRIDNIELDVNCTLAGTLEVYAHNYNVLRVMSGMGGLAYSN